MTFNDIEVAEQCHKIQALARTLAAVAANGQEMALFMALSDIQRAAEKAQWRLNDLLYGRGYKPAEEQMGQ